VIENSLTAQEARSNVGRVQLTINGEVHDVPAWLTILGLVRHLGLTDGPVAVERNREVVPRAAHERVHVESGDILEIVHFVGGG